MLQLDFSTFLVKPLLRMRLIADFPSFAVLGTLSTSLPTLLYHHLLIFKWLTNLRKMYNMDAIRI
ncbi:MAG: hypothetical protein CUN49_15345 [Candidatus Thermofonsia Clade 1 bacterium]|jgi:hypothetical protein|uniref:Uncharacterized protein n=1 Tax=Candidatus Thermofonsia Clade 1 bacterium TaxID=2364210 RepID=A0A2M8PAB8_9CHLR|nr:MAG: hypothetical protein CUN49_15345 [Candidatus Thermofonsia Clade 1 bacterium]PJF42595.1 MAG: hypothetical protein CUN50_03585 [Candidatus Thermofonsia Clade 1 bacterium]